MSDNRIDLHQHVVPPQYLSAFQTAGSGLYGGRPLPKWSAAEAIVMMDARDIAAGVLSLSTPAVTFLATTQASDMARAVNEFQAELVKDRPDRFGLFATIPLPDTSASLIAIAHAFDELNADGVVVLANSKGVYLGDPALEDVMAELNRRAALVFVHPSELPGPAMPGPAPALVDFLLDTTRAAVNLVVHGVPRRYPRIRFILSHAGGFVPYAHRVEFPNSSPMPLTLLNMAINMLSHQQIPKTCALIWRAFSSTPRCRPARPRCPHCSPSQVPTMSCSGRTGLTPAPRFSTPSWDSTTQC